MTSWFCRVGRGGGISFAVALVCGRLVVLLIDGFAGGMAGGQVSRRRLLVGEGFVGAGLVLRNASRLGRYFLVWAVVFGVSQTGKVNFLS